MNNDGLLPSDPDAEIGVLECCLADPSAINRAKKIIGPDDFSKNGGKELFQHLLSFHNSVLKPSFRAWYSSKSIS